ncbi:MAG TPA: hypothetical protein VHY79_17660 [Rhizomicrobium sp.]|jgi:hypothetical protein|nr:hypothetical protein [Rhizomicrobium sp.]
MAKTYRDVAITDMIGTIEDAMRQVLNCWAELPAPMNDAVEEFRARLVAAIDSVEFVRKALATEVRDRTPCIAWPDGWAMRRSLIVSC